MREMGVFVPRIDLRPAGWFGALIALTFSAAYFFYIVPGLDFVGGSSSYWQTQVEDVTQYISGLTAFVREPWSFPLLHIHSINWPTGTTVAFSDAIPLFALVVKAMGPLLPANPFFHLLCL